MIGIRAAAFARSIVMVSLLLVAAPWLLTWAARRRFGGSAPWSGVVPVDEWQWATIRAASTDRLTESTIADIVIRTSLAIAWIAVVVLFVIVVAEVIHMVRHGGLPMPDLRGLGSTQRLARVIAAGLLVVVPLVGHARPAGALDGTTLPRLTPAPETARPDNVWLDNVWLDRESPPAAAGVAPDEGPRPTAGHRAPAQEAIPEAAPVSEYVVRAGDSIYGIAERMAGPDQRAVAAYADELLDLNLGRTMPDGRRFGNAAYIDIGWVLELPGGAAATTETTGSARAHVVEQGETLWSIADDHLGEGERWPQIFEANHGRTFDDGRSFVDPDLIRPGWELAIPADVDRAGGDDAAEAAAGDEEASEGGAAGEPGTSRDAPLVSDELDDDAGAEGDDAGGEVAAAPDNAWVTDGVPAGVTPVATATSADVTDPAAPVVDVPTPAPAADGSVDESAIELLTMRRAAMLSAGVLTLLAVRRRNRLRAARPHARVPEPSAPVVATERTLRQIGAGDRFARVDLAVRAAASSLVEQGARVHAVVIAADGELELHASGAVELDAPWEPTSIATTWRLLASTPIELLAPEARRVGAPCPTLVQLGRDLAERDVYVDLEALEAIEVGGSGEHADAIIAAIATTLATSVLAEVVTLVGVGVADEAFLGHRLHQPARDVRRAFEAAAAAVGATAHAERPTFELRARVTGGETWEPAVVVAGASVGTVTPPSDRTGLAVVSASPIHGPSSRLAPEGHAWTLHPLGLRLVPIGLSPNDVAAIAELTSVSEPVDRGDDPDVTILGAADDHEPLDTADVASNGALATHGGARATEVGPPHALVVRLLGPVVVESSDGEPVVFERSKSRELVAWLATHRSRATRSNARSALWELDVRDATFANVVSEARRALARCVEPPDGEEWIGRTMTEQLPLHDLVVTDVDLLDHALDVARLQPPAQAIATLRPAVDRIAGLPFEGTAYLWPDAEGITSSIVMRAITGTSELATHCLSVGDIDGVFAASSAGLRVLPAHEEMIAVRMRAYARIGDRAGVRAEWETYERAITADPWSDGEPSRRMLDLRRELLAGQ